MDWHVRWMLRRHGLPDIPEVRRLMRASWRKGFTFRAAHGRQQMTAIRERALAAASREEIQACRPASLPPPEKLAEYDEIVPGTAERILSTTERTLMSAIDIAGKLANAEIQTARTGLSVASGLTLLAFAASVTSFALGYQVAEIALVAFTVVMLFRALTDGDGHDKIGGPGQPAGKPDWPTR